MGFASYFFCGRMILKGGMACDIKKALWIIN